MASWDLEITKKEKQRFNFRFHNPNSEETFVDLLVSVFMEMNRKKADEAIDKEIEKKDNGNEDYG